jgi:monofunctional biosynthetic peptidoglycan transglycosylase
MSPKTTALMKLRDQEYRDKGFGLKRQQIWVSYRAVSEHLKKAILISEDASFFSHNGIDFFELKEAIKEDLQERTFKRGGSTITMQLARNLYLSPSKNPLRKLKEMIIALQLEYVLSKERIFELYLNVVEWGPNIYGAEAAATHYFAKPASDLDEVEAATLAALLPSPKNPRGKELRYRRNLILQRMATIGYIGEAEYARGKEVPIFHQVKD